jgi:hypothetical protein
VFEVLSASTAAADRVMKNAEYGVREEQREPGWHGAGSEHARDRRGTAAAALPPPDADD